MDYVKRLKNDLNRFILTEILTNAEIETLIQAGDIIDQYRN